MVDTEKPLVAACMNLKKLVRVRSIDINDVLFTNPRMERIHHAKINCRMEEVYLEQSWLGILEFEGTQVSHFRIGTNCRLIFRRGSAKHSLHLELSKRRLSYCFMRMLQYLIVVMSSKYRVAALLNIF